MKFYSFMTIFILLAAGLGADIYSTTQGGGWNDPNTWIGGVVPGNNDNVVINGTVYVPNPASCLNLTVFGDGVLMNQAGLQSDLFVSGNLVNYGAIYNYLWGYDPGRLQIVVDQNVINYGTVGCYELALNGAADQHLSNSGTFNPSYLTDDITASALILDTDLVTGGGTNILMNNAQLILNGTSVHNLTGNCYGGQGSLRDAQVVGGNGAQITANNGFWLQNVSAGEIVLEGQVQVVGNLTVGHLINNGNIFNPIYGTADLYVTQRLDNYGAIKNHDTGGTLYFYLSGDLYDYGIISNYQIDLTGPAPHHLWQSVSAPAINCQNLTSVAGNGGGFLLSDLRIANCQINLGGAALTLFGEGTSHNLTQSGGSIKNAFIYGDPGCSMTLNALYLQNVTADRITLMGNMEINSGCEFGWLVNYAVLRNSAYQSITLSITQRLENRGSIYTHEAGGSFNLNLSGDLYNYGTIVTYSIDLSGAGNHGLWQSPTAPAFGCPHFYASTPGCYGTLLSDLTFANCIFDLSGNTLVLHDGAEDYDLTFQNCTLVNAVLQGGDSSAINGNAAILQYITADKIVFTGYIYIAGNGTVGRLVNYATVRNRDYWTSSFNITQRLENYQVIANSLYGGVLYLEVAGDLNNYNQIVLYRVLVNGTADQYIRNAGTINAAQGFQLVSEIGAAQWYFNGVLNNPEFVTNYAVNPNNQGVWQPFDGSIFGRNITIGSGFALSAPENIILLREGESLTLRWDQVPGAVYYTVYSSFDPDGTFSPDGNQVVDFNSGDGLVFKELSSSGARRFYRVTAGN